MFALFDAIAAFFGRLFGVHRADDFKAALMADLGLKH